MGVDLGSDGYAVMRVNKDVPRAASPASSSRSAHSFAQATGGLEAAAYYEVLKDRLKVKILVPRPAERVGGARS